MEEEQNNEGLRGVWANILNVFSRLIMHQSDNPKAEMIYYLAAMKDSHKDVWKEEVMLYIRICLGLVRIMASTRKFVDDDISFCTYKLDRYPPSIELELRSAMYTPIETTLIEVRTSKRLFLQMADQTELEGEQRHIIEYYFWTKEKLFLELVLENIRVICTNAAHQCQCGMTFRGLAKELNEVYMIDRMIVGAKRYPRMCIEFNTYYFIENEYRITYEISDDHSVFKASYEKGVWKVRSESRSNPGTFVTFVLEEDILAHLLDTARWYECRSREPDGQ